RRPRAHPRGSMAPRRIHRDRLGGRVPRGRRRRRQRGDRRGARGSLGLPPRASVAVLERIVGPLAATAKPQPVGLSWKSRPAWVPLEYRTPFDGAFNLGLAHGGPGIIALLGRVWR